MSTELIALLSLFVVQGFAIAKSIYDGRQKDKEDVRTRTWQVEDRQALAAEVARKVDSTAAVTATRLVTSTAGIAADIATQLRTHTDAVADALSADQRRIANQMADDARARKLTDAAAVQARAGLAATQAEIADTIEHDRRNRLAGAASMAAALDVASKKLDANTDLTRQVGETTTAAYTKASDWLERLESRVSGLDTRVGSVFSHIELLAGARAQSLTMEGTAHLADAQRITDELGVFAAGGAALPPLKVEVVNQPLLTVQEPPAALKE